MCGICGIVEKKDQAPDPALLQRMARTLRHRGPDDEGYEIRGRAGLGFQRLSIIDLAGGHQPMTNEDGRYWIVFNGEIYNFASLQAELEQNGRHRFKTRCDTEVILHAYEQWGENCVGRLRGMFAFAIWDSRDQTLFMARDRFGKKPLVYADLPDAFLFGSSIRALLPHPGVSRDIDYTALELYLSYQYIPSPWTIFRSIRKLPPAHALTFKNGSVTVQRYWEPRFDAKTSLSFPDAAQAMRLKLKEATQLRMVADVPLGAFLSGGMDSSVVVGLMSELSSRPVKTFCIGFEEEEFSELPHARAVADHFHCDHQEWIVRPNALEILPELARHYGEPFADASALPSYYVAKLARQYVTVALNGDGGDETLAGYARYQVMKAARVLTLLPPALRRALGRAMRVFPDGPPPHSTAWRLKRLLGLGLENPDTYYFDTLCFVREAFKPDLYSGFLKQETRSADAPSYLNRFLNEGNDLRGIDRYLKADLQTYLPECLMTKIDVATMAHSLEARSPFLDHEFVELVATFPDDWKLKGLWGTKRILRWAFRDFLPPGILARKKQGFSVPIGRWFRGPQKTVLQDTLLSDRAIGRGLFQKETIARMIDETADGRKDQTYALWALLMLEIWFQEVAEKH